MILYRINFVDFLIRMSIIYEKFNTKCAIIEIHEKGVVPFDFRHKFVQSVE